MKQQVLNLEGAARLLNLPDDTVRRWVRQGRIPCLRRGRALAFEKAELVTWARSRNMPVAGEGDIPAPLNETPLALADCLKRGGVFYDLFGEDKSTLLRAAAEQAAPSPEQAASLFKKLWERESLGSTGIGKGVAIPHPRVPDTCAADSPRIVTFFLREPAEFQALDGRDVFVFFLILCPTTRQHLHCLSRLAFCLRNDSFVEFLRTRPGLTELVQAVSELEPGAESGRT